MLLARGNRARFKADDPKAFRVYEAAAGLGMPVMFHHARMPSPRDLMRHLDPGLIDAVACFFPGLRIVLAHLGYPRVDETLYVARKHRNVWCDISWPYGDVNHPSCAREPFILNFSNLLTYSGHFL